MSPIQSVNLKKNVAPVADVTDDRVARPKSWYAALVRMNSERSVAKQLEALGIESFVATQTEIHDWSDRRKRIERVVIPMIVFVCIEESRCSELTRLSFVRLLMGYPGSFKPSPIPDEQIEKLRRMVGGAEGPVRFEEAPLEKGETVKITRGKLRGFVGELVRTPDAHSKLIVRLGCLGCASIELPSAHVERLAVNN